MKVIANVDRFHDNVTIYVGDGNTVYLTAKQARTLAQALMACAKSVVNEKFVDSNFVAVDVLEVSVAKEGEEIRKFPRNKENDHVATYRNGA